MATPSPSPSPPSNSHPQHKQHSTTAAPSPSAAQNPNPVISKKRPIDGFQDLPYFKLRAVVRDLRPFFIEVIKAPDLRDSKAAVEIQERMKLMLDLCRQMATETTPPAKLRITPENKHEQKPMAGDQQDMKTTEQPQAGRTSIKTADDGRFPAGKNSEKTLAGDKDDRDKADYVVGGSAFGWNFITFNRTEVVYYGRTKESFRAAKAKSSRS